MILRQYLPERSAEDILAGRIRLKLGPDWFELPVLTIDENEKWQGVVVETLGGLFVGLNTDNPPAAFARLAAGTDAQLKLLRTYDKGHTLPTVKVIRATTSNAELLRAVLEVIAAAFPLAAIVLDELTRNEDVLRMLIDEGLRRIYSEPTSLPPPSTAGTSTESEAA